MVEVQVAEDITVDQALVDVVARAAEAALRAANESGNDLSLTVVLSNDDELALLNQQYRDTEGPTDVLSFEAGDDFPDGVDEMRGYLGDVIISVERAAAQATAAGHSLAREMAVLAAHGTLHLLGFDHAEDEGRQVMWNLQDQAAADAVN